MIKAIILDVDGVIVGEKIGFNSPDPHPDVIHLLKKICQQNIPICLCTAKPYHAIEKIIEDARLNNPHITDGGSVLIDPIDKVIIKKQSIEKSLVKDIVTCCLQNNIYVELYAIDNYFIQKDQIGSITQQHQHILQKPPKVIESLFDTCSYEEIVKIMPIALNDEEKKRATVILHQFEKKATMNWAIHPVALPVQFCIITSRVSSKKQAVIEFAEYVKIPLKETLGIGDTTFDWQFIQLCGYAGVVANGTKELKEQVMTKGEGNYCIGRSVDENGALDILNFFIKKKHH